MPDVQTAGACAHHVLTPMLYARQCNETLSHCVVFASAQMSDKLRLAYLCPAMAHDEGSLAAIAANSAAASRACAHELLGRTDVQVSCVCPCVCMRVPVLARVVLFSQMLIRTISISAGYNGPADECHRVTQKTNLRFTWHLVAEGLNETCDVRLLCHDAARR